MTSSKIMLSGIVLLLTAVFLAALSGNTGTSAAGVALVLFPLGILVFFIGLCKKK